MNSKYLANWVFHYNTYRQAWTATERENYTLLFNNINSDKVIASSRIETLVELISKAKGDIVKIKNLDLC